MSTGYEHVSEPPTPWYEKSSKYGNFVQSQEHLLTKTEANPQPTTVPPPAAGLAGAIGERHVISFIGLPARGKPFMAERLCRYLSFFHGARCRVFDIAKPEWQDDDKIFQGLKSFLLEEDQLAVQQVEQALDSIEDADCENARKNVDSGRIAIIYSHDEMGTSRKLWSGSSKERRWSMQAQLDEINIKCKLLFIEVIVTDPDMVHKFLVSRAAAEEDEQDEGKIEAQVKKIEASIKDYSRIFVTLQDDGSEDDLSYMKMINYGARIVTNRMRGFLCMRIVQYLSHVHPRPHTIYLSRHGQSMYNAVHKIGGNPGLTEAGEAYAKWLGDWVSKNICCGEDGKQQPCRLWTSSMKRTIDTARHIPHPNIEMEDGTTWQQMALRVYRNLDEIFAGEYEGMTYEEIERTSGDEAVLRKKDKLGYRYPRGESYYDLIARLDALMHELESYNEPLLIVSHQATLRMVYAYLMGIDRNQAPKLDIPLHTVIKIQYDGYCRNHYQGMKGSVYEHASETRYRFEDSLEVSGDGQKQL
eukprot:gnl/MRDRNA2_/MRDRNA2_33815_c0_seq1.p1 gnl/MRDRNA2_/MRDRNA2_33815_c0~~gnl/MRDRNA2_/MRDRNA2_33815_c0_seq1.p1  ORF type:complete len:528 (-),score=91.45 gnl/MRDRNA2_/MRDRNA2_33815_c0_seq1:86-1669(-)